MRGALFALVIVGLPCAASADVVWSQPCPFGARERTSHSGPRCLPWPCTSDAECEDGLVCREWRVCVQTHEVSGGGRRMISDAPRPPVQETQVVGSCAPSEACTGSEEPRAPTSGRPLGEVRCEVAQHCVRPDLPALPSSHAPEESEGERAAPSTPPPREPATRGSACGCHAGSRPPATSLAALFAICIALAYRRSR